ISKYSVKNKKKRDILDKYTKTKGKNGVLAYFMEKLVSENLVSENTLVLVKECNRFMMLVADDKLEKKKQHKGTTCTNRICPICAYITSRQYELAIYVYLYDMQTDV